MPPAEHATAVDPDPAPAERIAVAYLHRRVNPPHLLPRFVAAYRRHSAGLPHELIVILKDCGPDGPASLRGVLDGIAWSPYEMPDIGRDIGAYLRLARDSDHDVICFLNSYARPLADGWLAKLYAGLSSSEAVGVAGATGSWWRMSDQQPFPNYNIRTNGFMIRRRLLLSIGVREVRDRQDAVLFEAGPLGLTAQLRQRGLHPLVVDAEGIFWRPELWPVSRTFFSGAQERLLIADNRTDAYLASRPDVQAWYRKITWTGERAGRRPDRAPKWMRRLGARIGLGLR